MSTHHFQPLVDVADRLAIDSKQVIDTINECKSIIDEAELKPCPFCGDGDDVRITTSTPIDIGLSHPITVECLKCHILTEPQYWFENELQSATSALHTAIGIWNARHYQEQSA